MSDSAGRADGVPLDLVRFEALAEFDEANRDEVLAEMARLFACEVETALTSAEAALIASDPVALRHVGHRLKSACGAIGADRMRIVAIDMERAGTAHNLVEAKRLVERLATEWRTVLETLGPYRLLKEQA